MSDVLSQEEIDALLNAISSGDVDAQQMRDEAREPQVRSFDFQRPSKFSKDQLRTLEMMHDNFCRLAGTQLSGQLRTLVELSVVSADQLSYGEFVNSMPVPTLINIVSAQPLEGNAVLEMGLPLVFSVVDRLAGGPGTNRPRMRELTEIEQALMRGVSDVLLQALSESWSAIVPVSFKSAGVEMNPQFAQIVAPSDMVVLITFEVHVGQSTGMLSLCVPYLVLEPAIGRFSAQSYFSGKEVIQSPEAREEIASELGVVEVPVSVELGGTRMLVSDLLALEPGDVIPLETMVGGDVTLSISGRAAFRAQPGTRGKRVAVQVTAAVEEYIEGAIA